MAYEVLGNAFRGSEEGYHFGGYIEKLTLETLWSHYYPYEAFFSETLLLPSTGIAKMPPEHICWPILGLCWPIYGVYIGAIIAHLGVYIGAILPHLGFLLDHVVGDVGPSGIPRR